MDFATGLTYTLFCLLLTATLGFNSSLLTTLSLVAISLMQTAPLMMRRSKPWLATLIITLGHLLQLAFAGLVLPSQLSVPIMVYTMAVYGKRWQSFTTLGFGWIGALLATFSMFNSANSSYGFFSFDMMVSFVGLALVVTVSWTFGDLARNRRLTMKALQDHAARLENERIIERDLAAADERNHIAREMHDIVAHSLSVIITQADGARYAAVKDPSIAIDTLKTVSDTGRASLREMRRLLGVLRKDEEVANRPLPTLANIPDLVQNAETAGLDVRFGFEGSPRKELPAGAELTAYRSVQEALTNVVKHAGPNTTASVQLSWISRGLEISIEDNGRGAGSLTFDGQGYGLQGMSERVALYDGTCSASPRTGGGFTVSVFIPYSED
ncbi:sensor histidine kinase [Glutamicibacter protophormiae]|uniref:sensor histidine kinase n=1 Tax=Glutamicibacter protophormiae TaxID=37930 RepID=UPI002A81B802|nr:sensor histidine kinase [Glutamicibacter protophormiae]WPR66148.1 sensor histidine kinase [Glutamicibacter protophormiae]WPR69645.1 sensor histidine kinase [Glutamicibacter protophormiae]